MLQLVLAVLLFALLITLLYKSIKDVAWAKAFIWLWAILLSLACFFPEEIQASLRTNVEPVAILFLVSMLGLFWLKTDEELDAGTDPQINAVRKLLDESNKRINEERKRISSQIHDQIGPSLIFVKRSLEWTLGQAESKNIQDILRNALDELDKTYLLCRDIVRTTRIEVLETLGLIPSLRSLTKNYQSILERTEIVFETNLPEDASSISQEMSLVIYLIAQEAVLNAVRHANASRILVRLNQDAQGLNLDVHDDGQGFDVNKTKKTDGVGLLDMKERSRSIGGEIRIESGKEGTSITLFVAKKDQSDHI